MRDEFRKREVEVCTVNVVIPGVNGYSKVTTKAGIMGFNICLANQNYNGVNYEFNEDLAVAIATIVANQNEHNIVTITKETKTIEEARVY